MTLVHLGDVRLSALGSISWAMTTGIAPYTNIFECHKSDWDTVKGMMGKPQVLKVQSLNGRDEFKDIYPLHEVQSSSPNRRAFMCADKRWKWPYKLIVRDYNMTRKSGERTLLKDEEIPVPIELVQYVDRYKYLGYSLDRGNAAWSAKRVLEDVLEVLEPGGWQITSIPIADTSGVEGQFSIQNFMLRDPGHLSMGRALTQVPGSEVTVLKDGTVDVFDGTDLQATEDAVERLGSFMIGTNIPRRVDKSAIRPKGSKVYFVREIESRFEYEDNQAPGATVVPQNPDEPWMWNVLPLPDPVTPGVGIYDQDGNREEVDAPQGTWVRVNEALKAWEKLRQERAKVNPNTSTIPFTFESIRKLWGPATIDAAAIAERIDEDTTGDERSRWSTIKQHFRQTFQLNPRYMDRIREVKAIRVALLDPFTGTRSPAMMWSQYCIVPSNKGIRVTFRGEKSAEAQDVLYNVNQYPGFYGELSDKPASQGIVTVRDGQLGIIRIDYTPGPYGLQQSFIPSMLVDSITGEPHGLRRNLGLQDENPIALGATIGERGSAVHLDYLFQMCCVVTITMNSPNTKKQMHEVKLSAADIREDLRTKFGIEDGNGPELEIFIPPSISTARYAWRNTIACRETLADLFGVASDDDEPGLAEGSTMEGFTFVNEEDEVRGNAKAAALEVLQSYADAWIGDSTTIYDPEARPIGYLTGVTHTVSPSPGGAVRTNQSLAGQPKPIDRYAYLPETVRHITLGILPYKTDGSNR